jgi:hypothetical protein
MKLEEEELLYTLPHLLDIEIYKVAGEYGMIDSNLKSASEPVNLIEIKPKQEPKPMVLPPIQKVEIKTYQKQVNKGIIKENLLEKRENTLISKKILIIVAYKDTLEIPTYVTHSYQKMFERLGFSMDDVQFINALDANTPQANDYKFEYLILMGGSGKNLNVLSSYQGSREFGTIAQVQKVKILFCDKMEYYLTDNEKKSNLWSLIKALFS